MALIITATKEWFKKVGKKIHGIYVIKEAGKKKANFKSWGLSFGITALIFVGIMIFNSITQDTSVVTHTDREIRKDQSTEMSQEPEVAKNVAGVLGKSLDPDAQEEKKPRKSQSTVSQRKYKAKQVIEREGVFERDKTIPMGTNLIGQLLTSIDTREIEQFYKVFLPYGGKFRGGAEIPKGSTLYGKIKYSGQGKKVFMSFSKGVFPTGEEFEIQAQALNSKDYSPGILGDFHGKSGMRIAATLGLSVVSGASTVLTEREQMGNMGLSMPKATLKNAALGGVAQAADTEAQRQAQVLTDEPEYVTIDAGKDLIVNLTGAYVKK